MSKIFSFINSYIKKYKLMVAVWCVLVSFSSVTSLALPYISSNFIDFLTAINWIDTPLEQLMKYCVCFAGIGLFSIFIGFLSNRLYTYLTTKLEYEISKSLVSHIQNLEISFLANQNYASLSQQINMDVNSMVIFFFDILQNSLINILKFIVSLYLLYRINRQILFLLLIILFVYVLIFVWIKPKLYNSIYKIKERQVDFFSELYKQLHFFKFIKAQGLTRVFLNKLIVPFEKLLETIMKAQTIQYFFNGLDSIVVILAQISIFIIGGISIIKEDLSIGEFTLLSSYFGIYIVGVRFFLGMGKSLQTAQVSYQRVKSIMDEPCSPNGENEIGSVSEIEMKNVSFSYNQRSIFQGFSYKFEVGKCYGVFGENGAGKTTLIYVLMGLLKCDSGTITYNGIDITDLNMIMMREKRIGYSEQEPIVLGDVTLIANLFLVKVLEHPTLNKGQDSDLDKDLLEMFGLDKFMDIDLNAALNRFHNLSGGEKQKIAVVRTLLKDVSLLIFDEPTSMMDQESINHFCQVIKKIKDKKIIIIISHEDSILSCCDELINI